MAPHPPRRSEHPGAPVALLDHPRAHRSTWGAPRWPPTPPSARTRPGPAGARLGLATGCLIDRRGGGPPRPPPPPPPPPPPGAAAPPSPARPPFSLGGARERPPPPPPPPRAPPP